MLCTQEASERDGSLGNQADISGIMLNHRPEFDPAEGDLIIEAIDESSPIKIGLVFEQGGIKSVFAGILVSTGSTS
jgi:hypothetical protein